MPSSFLWAAGVWLLSGTNALLYEMCNLAFAFIFCHWGFSYLCAVMFNPIIGQILVVLVTFCFTILGGMTTGVAGLVNGALPMNLFAFASSIRWGMGVLFRMHFEGDSYNIENLRKVYTNDIKYMGGALIQGNCPPEAPVYRWQKDDGMVCSVEPLLLIGILCRIIVAAIIIMRANINANGGAFECKGTVRTGVLGVSLISAMSFFMRLFLLLFFFFNVSW